MTKTKYVPSRDTLRDDILDAVRDEPAGSFAKAFRRSRLRRLPPPARSSTDTRLSERLCTVLPSDSPAPRQHAQALADADRDRDHQPGDPPPTLH